MRVTVSLVEPESRSMAVGQGIDDEGSTVTFGLETRYAIDIAQALDAGEDVVVELEPWMILSRTHG